MYIGEVDEELIDEELAHASIEGNKPQDLQLANWRPGRADDVIPVQTPRGLRPMKIQHVNLRSEGRGKICPSSKAIKQEKFPLTHRRVSLVL
jgi:hypothetical protein